MSRLTESFRKTKTDLEIILQCILSIKSIMNNKVIENSLTIPSNYNYGNATDLLFCYHKTIIPMNFLKICKKKILRIFL